MDVQALRARADELINQFDRMRCGLPELQQQLKSVSATVTSDDGLVTVVVGPRGQVVRVDFDQRIYRRPNPRELSATVTETIQQASEQVMAQVTELCRRYVPHAQLQAYLDHDLEGILRQLASELPGGDQR